MNGRINPFNELYVTETIGSADFVRIFSPYIIRNAEALFLPGNIVLQGVQGSGKSMLLSLLKPEVRLAYAQADERFPLEGRYAKFLGAGINLTRSRAIDFGQRPIGTKSSGDIEALPLYFGDFLNYWIVFDILRSAEVLGSADPAYKLEIRPDFTLDRLDAFARSIAADDCWFGYLAEVSTYEGLKNTLSNRINQYLSFLNFNIPELPQRLAETKTSVGQPLSRTATHLHESGIIADDVEIFIRVDQYEELTRLEGIYKDLGPIYRRVVNKAIGLRDPHVSYRIGTRRYAWSRGLEFYGTTGQLEEDRNYKLIDLDEILRRKENAQSWVFPSFAEDVFRKRLAFAGHAVPSQSSCLSHVLGKGLSAEKKALHYAGKAPQRAVRVEAEWPDQWKSFLLDLATADPLSARLAEAWSRQKNKSGVMHHLPEPPFPWEKPYWRKERLEQSLMQIAGRCGQRMAWAGRDEVLQLSGSNILVFVSLCQHIWSAWLRTVRDRLEEERILPEINELVQAVGIHEASTHWFQKITEDAGGDSRQRFVRYLGTILEKQLFEDLSLSYPGNNGFSLTYEELDNDSGVKSFLNDAVAYGDLFDAPHTTKEKNRKQRRKWYLNPVLSPHFRLPHVRTKEPMYVSVDQVRGWMRDAHLPVAPDKQPAKLEKSSSRVQRSLFQDPEEA
jgi:hypothetical protein